MHSWSQLNFDDTRVEKLGVDLVSRFSSTVLSLIAGMMICVVFSMSSELVVKGEENEVVTVSEFAGPRVRVDVSDFEE